MQYLFNYRHSECGAVSSLSQCLSVFPLYHFPDSYEHTSRVFSSYESNISKTCTWLYDTFNKTLRGDFDKAEETVRRLARTLREHREEIFSAARK